MVLGRSLISPDLLQFSEYAQWVKFLLRRPESYCRIVFRTFVPIFAQAKGEARMTAVDQLIKYILTLTPEQVDKVVNQIPRLIELLSESSQPCPPEQSAQNQ